MFKRHSLAIVAIMCGTLALPLAVASAQPAPTDAAVVVPVDAGSGSAAAPAPAPSVTPAPVPAPTVTPVAPASAATPAPAPTTPLDDLADVKAKYDALRDAMRDKSPTLLLWAAMLAAALKLMLSLFSRYVLKESKTWTKWIALGAAVPIALLSHYAGGFSLFDSLVFAGAGPGAIIIHELLKRKS
jgi:hypothetical protein